MKLKFMEVRKNLLKKIDKKAADLLIEWLKNIVNEDERDQITKENYKELLPSTKYILALGYSFFKFS